MTKFYEFRQNNSGGSFDHDEADGIGWLVVVEAHDADHANARAKRIGLYFNGCASGRDCDCCGDRWSSVDETDGSEVPGSYGEPLGAETKLYYGIPAYVHYLGSEGVVRFPSLAGATP